MKALIILVILGGLVLLAMRFSRQREADAQRRRLASVRTLADEDITRFGEELQQLDLDTSGRDLDEGTRADYQRALDAYEAAKQSSAALQRPEDVRGVTEIVEDGRYATHCVRARLEGQPLPTRRPPCFFDPRHGPSVSDVSWAPPGGTPRDVPACALDAERVAAGAEPDIRQVQTGSRRQPYWQAGPAYAPYSQGYFGGFAPMGWMFTGMMLGGGWGGWGDDGFGYDGFDGGGFDNGGFDGGDGGGFDGGGIDQGAWGGDVGGDFGGGDFGGDGGFDGGGF